MTRQAGRDDPRPRCPTCRTPVTWADNAVRPFCSLRCKLVELGGWLDERYLLPGSAPLVSQPATDAEPRP